MSKEQLATYTKEIEELEQKHEEVFSEQLLYESQVRKELTDLFATKFGTLSPEQLAEAEKSIAAIIEQSTLEDPEKGIFVLVLPIFTHYSHAI